MNDQDVSYENFTPSEVADEPVQIRTFLIADIRGYTRFTQEHGDEGAASLASAFATMTQEGVDSFGGKVIELRGDEALAVFTSTRNAIRAALDLQSRYGEHSRMHPEAPLEVGIGIDAGEAVPVQGGYCGSALNLAARLCSIAGPGRILATDAVTHLARKVDGASYVERGAQVFKGLHEPVWLVEIVSTTAPPTTSSALIIQPSSASPARVPFAGLSEGDFSQAVETYVREQVVRGLTRWGERAAQKHQVLPGQGSPGSDFSRAHWGTAKSAGTQPGEQADRRAQAAHHRSRGHSNRGDTLA
jgi:class 3 adenylate cyclase